MSENSVPTTPKIINITVTPSNDSFACSVPFSLYMMSEAIPQMRKISDSQKRMMKCRLKVPHLLLVCINMSF